ncbi:hypothetical protein EDC04DRAFT_2607019 [Pisolithus marmoratus]|nr:hypothetical protein EDC04DRAFT_2607019 [Pisolithus marmoratus]
MMTLPAACPVYIFLPAVSKKLNPTPPSGHLTIVIPHDDIASCLLIVSLASWSCAVAIMVVSFNIPQYMPAPRAADYIQVSKLVWRFVWILSVSAVQVGIIPCWLWDHVCICCAGRHNTLLALGSCQYAMLVAVGTKPVKMFMGGPNPNLKYIG